MTKKLIIILVVLVLVAAFLSQNKKTVSNDTVEVNKIGAIMPLSGPAGSLGEGLKRALDMAGATHVELVYADDECNTAKAVSAYNNLKTQNIKVYFVACSGSVMALAPLAKTDNNLIITGYAGSSEIRATGDEVIRFDPDAVSIVSALVKELSDPAWSTKKFAILHEKQDYAQSAVDALQKKFGDQILMTESYQAADISMKTQITKLKGSGAEVIIFVPVSDKASDIILKEMKDLGVSLPIVGEVNLCGFTQKPSNFGLHGFCLNQKIDTEGARTFEADYLKKYAIASQYPVNDGVSYDSVKIMDKLFADGIRTISGLKEALLKGVQGGIMKYEFEPNGEVLDKGYFTKETY